MHLFIKFSFLFVFTLASTYNVYSQQDIKFGPDSISTKILTPVKINSKDTIVNYGKLFLNTPYHYGSEGASSFDCSGFTSFVYRNFGYKLLRSSHEQAEQFPTVSRTQLEPGDLVFFEGRRHNGRVGHVGMVVNPRENGQFDFIHASVQDGVTISTSEAAYYKKRFIKAGRVIDSTYNLLAINDNTANVTSNQQQQQIKKVEKIVPAQYHFVKAGETLSSISKKYNISIGLLKRNNKLKRSSIHPKQQLLIKDEKVVSEYKIESAQNSLSVKSDTLLEIIQKKQNENVIQLPEKHKVKRGETIERISKNYSVSLSELKRINKLSSNKILAGQEIMLIETENLTIKNDEKPIDNSIIHHVLKGETLFSISKIYNIEIEDLKQINNLSSSKLHVGQSLVISKSNAYEKISSANTDKSLSKTIKHNVKNGQSMYSIAKIYNCTIEELKKWNDKNDTKLLTGEQIIVYFKAL